MKALFEGQLPSGKSSKFLVKSWKLNVLTTKQLYQLEMVSNFVPNPLVASGFSWENNGKIGYIFLPEQNSLSLILTSE